MTQGTSPASPPLSAEELAETILDRAAKAAPRRILVALAGPPGVGKSTLTERLAERLDAERPGCCGLLPMDGYHFDDAVLVARGDRPRKGAPFTFDLGGLGAMIGRLKADGGEDIAVPVFDRSLEIARAGARIIPATARIILVEGNYLLLDALGWRDLRALFDLTVMLAADERVLERRLLARWDGFGLEGQALLDKMEGNDLPNLRLVLRESLAPDLFVRTDQAPS